ncbi:hypothetical protein ACFGFP_004812, partial [Enterobacter hormaechei]
KKTRSGRGKFVTEEYLCDFSDPAAQKKFGQLPLKHPDDRILTAPRIQVFHYPDSPVYAFAPFSILDRLQHAGKHVYQRLCMDRSVCFEQRLKGDANFFHCPIFLSHLLCVTCNLFLHNCLPLSPKKVTLFPLPLYLR